MFLQLTLFSLVAIMAADAVPTPDTDQSPSSPLGVGGNDVDIKQVPYQVSLHARGSNYCGGSIISPTWLVTAAQCVRSPTSQMSVRSGSTKQSSGGQLHMVKQAVKHPNFTINKFNVPINDVAVIQVSTPFELQEIPKVITLSKTKIPKGSNATITGWGATSDNQTVWDTLQRQYQPIISTESCDAAYNELFELPQEKICSMGSDQGVGTCHGDEGSPVTFDNQLAGIVSWHYGCAKGFPDVHTDVYSFRNWIISETGISE